MATLVTRSGKGSPLTHAEVDANFTNLNTDKLELSGGTMTGNLSFGDNDKAIFGAGTDLQIYHNGSNSYIQETGTGNLFVASDANVNITNQSTNELKATFISNGAVNLYYDNAKKLATTSTGVDITGTLTSDGLTVDGVAKIQGTATGLVFNETDTTDLNGYIINNNGDLNFMTVNDAFTSFDTRLQIDHATGDISFYEDTGTTAKFFWDASAESLGIGTTSPSSYHANADNLVIQDSGNAGITIATTDSAYFSQINFADGTTGAQAYTGILRYAHSDNSLRIIVTPGERMRIDSSGNLLVGKTGSAFGTEGVEVRPDTLWVTRDGDTPVFLNRLTSDGSLLSFSKDNSTVGSIGVAGGNNLKIASTATDHGGLAFGTHVVAPLEANADSDGTIDLGASAARFKDLYLSGGVYLGGTGSANKLDDYEEGTWTISFSGGTVSPSNSTGYYTKIGNRVFVQYYSGSSTITGASGSAYFSGLPFTVATGSFTFQPFYTTHNTFFGGSTSVGIDGFFSQNNTIAYFMQLGTTSTVSYTNGSSVYIMLAGSYYAA